MKLNWLIFATGWMSFRALGSGLFLFWTFTGNERSAPSEWIIPFVGDFIIGVTAVFTEQLDMDKEGSLITKPDSTETNIPGVYAAGDVKDKTFRQAVTAAGMGCMAALEAEKHLSS